MSEVGLFIVGEPSAKFMKRNLFNHLMNIITEKNLKKIVYVEGGSKKDKLYVFLDINKHKEIFNLFKKYEVLISYENLTDNFLFQKDIDPIFYEENFKVVLNDFLTENLEKDMILDKINKMGLESLNEIDYSILNK